MKRFLPSCILSVLLSVSCFAVTPQYKPRTDIETGFMSLNEMVIADFNGDGKPDIAAGSPNTKGINIYLNDGIGLFGPATQISLSAWPNAITAGDFNEDGKQDLIISVSSGSPLFLSGNGDGTFISTASTSAPGCVTFAVADFNQDKHLDIACGGNGSFATYSGDGHGNFQRLTSDPSSSGLITGIAMADFNKDGKVDLAAVSPVQSAGIRYYAGYGDATFSAPFVLQNATLSAPGSIAAADFDGDNNIDLLVSSDLFSYIVNGAGNGTFDLSGAVRLSSYPPGVTMISPFGIAPKVAASDLDGNGKTDILVANPYSPTLAILMNDGTGKFPVSLADYTNQIDGSTSALTTADLNGDGLPDIILASSISGRISIFLSVRPKALPEVIVTPSSPITFVGTPINVTVKVTNTNNIVPTGSVTLMDHSTSLVQQTLDATGQVTFPLTTLATGYHEFSATYTGDANYFSQTSILVGQAMMDIQIGSTTTSQTVSAGNSASYSLAVTPAGGFAGTITLTCSQLPALTTCDPTTVTSFGQPVNATLTVRTTAPVAPRSSNPHYTVAFLPLLAFCFRRGRRRAAVVFTVSLMFGMVFSAVGCSSSTAPATIPGTPSGSSTFTITASTNFGGNILTRTTTATLVVQ